MTGAIPLHRTPTDLRTLLQGTLEVLRAQAVARDVTLRIESPTDLPRVRVDAEKIAWAVATLVGNALRYVRHGPGIPADKAANLFRRGAGVAHGPVWRCSSSTMYSWRTAETWV